MLNTKDRRNCKDKKMKYDYEIALAGNPNVGKSTIFNALTGLKQHTGNWSGKTVSNAVGFCEHKDLTFKVVDLPGTYTLNSGSQEQMIAKDYIIENKYACVIIVLDSTNLERNLSLVIQVLNITTKVIVCVNMLDQAKKKNITIDLDELSLQLGTPVIGTSARDKKSISQLKDTVAEFCSGNKKAFRVNSLMIPDKTDRRRYMEAVYEKCTEIFKRCTNNNCARCDETDRKIDKILTSKKSGILVMLLLLGVLFWLTIVGANYPSEWLSTGFNYIKEYLQAFLYAVGVNSAVVSFLIDGVYTTLAFVVSVMLPPMTIFFPIFSLLEDSGYLPRIAFNLDNCFKKANADGKQALTMAMGFGCNACGVMGCRIIESQREKNIAILTNNFIPCNGRLPSLITISTIFIATSSYAFLNSVITSVTLVLLILFSVFITLIVSKLLSKTVLKGQSSSFILELPPYRKPQIFKTIMYSLKDRAWFVLLRAISVAIPAGAIIWCMANIKIYDESVLWYCTEFLRPFGQMIGLDGVIVMAFLLGFPANETVIPVILMSYLSTQTLTDYSDISALTSILSANGWTIKTAICFLVMCVFHFPCSTTLLTIKKETNSLKLTVLSAVLPTVIGIILCLIINLAFSAFV